MAMARDGLSFTREIIKAPAAGDGNVQTLVFSERDARRDHKETRALSCSRLRVEGFRRSSPKAEEILS